MKKKNNNNNNLDAKIMLRYIAPAHMHVHTQRICSHATMQRERERELPHISEQHLDALLVSLLLLPALSAKIPMKTYKKPNTIVKRSFDNSPKYKTHKLHWCVEILLSFLYRITSLTKCKTRSKEQ